MNVRRNFVIAFLLLLLFSCKRSSCTDETGIHVSELLLITAGKQSYEYCELLRKAVKNDKASIKTLSLLEFNDAAGYDHGSVIVDLILLIGEENYVDAVKEANSKEKSTIEAYIDVGLEYGNNPDFKSQSLNSAFPTLAKVLQSR